MRAPLAPVLVVLLLVGCVSREDPPSEPAWRAAEGDAPVSAARVVTAQPAANATTEENASVSTNATSAPPAAPPPAANETETTPPPAASNDTAADAPATHQTTTPPPTNATTTNSTANATRNATTANASKVLFNGTHDFAGVGLPFGETDEDTFTVPAGYARLVVNVTFTRSGEAGLLDREGSIGVYAPGAATPAGTLRARAGTSGNVTATATAGEWTLRYDGQSPVEATIVVTAYRE